MIQVYAMPVYDMIEYQLVKRGVPNGFPTRLVYRTVYIIIVAFIGMTIPFFGGKHLHWTFFSTVQTHTAYVRLASSERRERFIDIYTYIYM